MCCPVLESFPLFRTLSAMAITGTFARSPVEDKAERTDSSRLLIDQLRSGDREAFKQVVRRFQGPLLSYVFHMIRNLQDAEDVVQETFIRVHRSIHQLRDTEKLWEWLKRIAHNAAMDFVRHAGRRGTSTDPAVIQEMADEQHSKESQDVHTQDSDSPNLSLEKIVGAIEELPDIYRQAAIYRFLQEWPYAAIAEALGLEPATVRQRISRATKMLRTSLLKPEDPQGQRP